ncbi:hypothetical protein [Hymenobacter siberiensis]|jgi:hypothetical protein|uniref:hypothetical protein n=1 Tax=Hymenobacter siberiensis TaxID=2848396 RepID=UPI001C1E2528|nr:hypothetical protein [Hymenobacter siberiensis]
MRTHWLFVLLLWSRVFSSAGQAYAPASFREMPPPAIWSAAWSKLNYAPGYAVKNVDGKLVVGKSSKQESPQLLTPDGTFLGQDHGEWGGKLLFQSAANPTTPVRIKEGNIRLIFQANGGVYFIEGLAHGSLNAGALYQITGKAPAFAWVKLADFDDAPEAFAVVGSDVYIAQFHGFTVLRNLQKEVILKKTFWSSLYPNSVAVFNNNEVCIGLRGGYVRLNTRTKAFQFFQYMP